MPTAETFHRTLQVWAQAVAALFTHWQLKETDWYLADESTLLLQGYAVPPAADWQQRLSVDVDETVLPWEVADPEAIAPPPDTPVAEELAALIADQGIPLQLVSSRRFAIPITFRTTVELPGEQKVEVAAPRALARMRTVTLLERARLGEAVSPQEAAAFGSEVAWLQDLAGIPWPRRDRWFGRFWADLADIYTDLAAQQLPRPSQVTKFGRRHTVL